MVKLLENGLKPIVIFDGLLNTMKIRHQDVKIVHHKISDALVSMLTNVNYLFETVNRNS